MSAITIHPVTLRALLVALREGANLAELRAATGLSRPSVYRNIAALRALGMRIERVPRAGFVVADWGVFNPGRLPP